MRVGICKSMGLFNLLVKLNCTDKYIYIYVLQSFCLGMRGLSLWVWKLL